MATLRDLLHGIGDRLLWKDETQKTEFHTQVDEVARELVEAKDAPAIRKTLAGIIDKDGNLRTPEKEPDKATTDK